MLLILDLGIKTVVKRSDVFHIWNFVCDNFFFLISALEEEKVESKPLIQDVLEGDRNILGFFPSGESPIKIFVNMREPCSVDSFPAGSPSCRLERVSLIHMSKG